MSGWSTDSIDPRRAPSCSPARARRPAVSRTSSDPARFRKPYWAIVEGQPELLEGQWNDILEKDRRLQPWSPGSASVTREGQLARVHYRVVKCGGGLCKLELRPHTGRSHQSRVQLAGRGLPILGDRKYGAATLLEAEDGVAGSRCTRVS